MDASKEIALLTENYNKFQEFSERFYNRLDTLGAAITHLDKTMASDMRQTEIALDGKIDALEKRIDSNEIKIAQQAVVNDQLVTKVREADARADGYLKIAIGAVVSVIVALTVGYLSRVPSSAHAEAPKPASSAISQAK